MASRSLFSDEQGIGVRSKKPIEGELDITPMIDVTFLLLIFFMVCSTMQGKPDIDVPPAVHSLGIDAAGATVVTIMAPVNDSASPTIILGDIRGDEGDLNDVRRYVEDQAKLWREKNQGPQRVVIKAEGDVSHGTVEEVARQIKSVEGVELYMGVGEKPQE